LCFEHLIGASGLAASATRLTIPRLLCSKTDDREVGPDGPATLEDRER
jgi:hypothetical protein